MKPQIFIILVLSLVKQSFGQVTNIEAWQGFFSYTDIKALASGGDKIYAASENAVFSYNLLTTETETLTTIDGLSGEFITTFHFSNDYDVLIIGYKNMKFILGHRLKSLRTLEILAWSCLRPNF